MGRARKPLEMQKGNLTVEQQEQKRQAEALVTVGREQLAKPPSWLMDKVAKAEFKRIVREFDKVDVVGNLDLNNIAGYCNAYAMYRKVTKRLEDTEIVITVPDLDSDSPREVPVMNPLYRDLVKNQRDYADEMRKFAALCGLTIDSRLKVGTVQTTQQNQEIEEIFGDI